MQRLARGTAIAAAAAVSLVIGVANPAHADDQSEEAAATVAAVEAATAMVDAATGTEVADIAPAEGDTAAVAETSAGTVEVPATTEGDVIVGEGAQAVTIGLPTDSVPADASLAAAGDIVVYSDTAQPADLAVQATEQGVRALITIKDASAPHTYAFPVEGPEGSRLVTAAEYGMGVEYDTGEVLLVAADGVTVLGLFDAPWATDANGAPVPTHYEVSGTSLTQVVEFDQHTAFPVVADPSFWSIAKCAAAIAAFVATNMLVVSKLIKVKQYINALGGFRRAAELMLRASTWEERFRIGGNALAALAAEILGFALIRNNC